MIEQRPKTPIVPDKWQVFLRDSFESKRWNHLCQRVPTWKIRRQLFKLFRTYECSGRVWTEHIVTRSSYSKKRKKRREDRNSLLSKKSALFKNAWMQSIFQWLQREHGLKASWVKFSQNFKMFMKWYSASIFFKLNSFMSRVSHQKTLCSQEILIQLTTRMFLDLP